MAACQVAWKTLPRGCDCDMCLLTCTLSAQLLVPRGVHLASFVFWLILPPQETTSYRASTGIFAEKKKMNGSESLLAVKWVQTAESPAGPGAASPVGQPDIRRRGAPPCTLQGHSLSSQPHCGSPHLLAGPCLCSTCPCLCERSKRSHRTLFFIPFPEKWANSQLQSLGEFPVWESGNCQEWKAAASQ